MRLLTIIARACRDIWDKRPVFKRALRPSYPGLTSEAYRTGAEARFGDLIDFK